MPGILLGLGSGLGYAFYSIFARYALAKYSVTTVIFYTFLFSSLAIVWFADLGEIGPRIAYYEHSWLLILGLSVVSTAVPYVLYTNGLAHMETSKASIMAFVEPVVSLIIGAVVFHDNLTLTNYAGVVMILVAVTLLNIRFRSSRDRTESSDIRSS